MECSCEIDSCCDDCESNQFYRIKIVKAKKRHHCEECGRYIEPGEVYTYESGKNSDGLFTAKTCSDCQSARDVFFKRGYIIGCIWDEITENIFEWNGEVPESCIAELTPRSRGKVCEIIEDYFLKHG